MLEFIGISNEVLIIGLSALLAAVSFMSFAFIFLNKEERKERYKDIVQKRRRALYEAAKSGQDRKAKEKNDNLSASESLALLFKMQQKLGGMGERIRDQMLQAGYRNPNAPFKFIIARMVLPFVFLLLSIGIVWRLGTMDYNLSPVLAFLLYVGTAGFGFMLPAILVKNQIIKRQQDIEQAFPDTLDMMLICVQGGIGLEQTVNRVADEIAEHAPTLAEELGILSAEMSMLNDRRAALGDFARRLGSPAAKSFSTALVQAEQYGTSVSNAMRVLSEEMRDIRMQRAEEKAMSLPPKLTVPMILFFLPSLFIVILGPVGIQISNM